MDRYVVATALATVLGLCSAMIAAVGKLSVMQIIPITIGLSAAVLTVVVPALWGPKNSDVETILVMIGIAVFSHICLSFYIFCISKSNRPLN